jgi:hypothetical protein
MSKSKIQRLREVHAIQGDEGNWNYDNYMVGLFNGLELALAIIENREPEFRETQTPTAYDLANSNSKPIMRQL